MIEAFRVYVCMRVVRTGTPQLSFRFVTFFGSFRSHVKFGRSTVTKTRRYNNDIRERIIMELGSALWNNEGKKGLFSIS